MKTQAAVLRGHTDPYLIENIELPEPGPLEIVVKISGTGMCHTDLLPRSEASFAQPPIITGHEGAGVVVAIGSAVAELHVGDHVVLTFDSCGDCRSCRSSHPAYCDTFFPRNLFGNGMGGPMAVDSDGAPLASRWFGQSSFAGHVIATARNAVVVDPSLPIELLGPLGCGVLTGAGSVINALCVGEGDSLVVFGAGAVGLAAVMAARVVGAARIVAVDLHQSRLDLALELGATDVIPAGDDVADRIRALIGAADFTFDTTGVPGVIEAAIGVLRSGGTCGLVGIQTGNVTLDPMSVGVGRTVKGILEGDSDPHVLIPRLIELWQNGQFPFDRLITTFPLSEINEAERRSLSGEVVKPVLLPDESEPDR